MATPVVTGSNPPDYAPYRNAINQIVYSKGQYSQGQRNNNQGMMNWAQQNAQQYYGELPTELANQLRGMDYNQAQQFYKGLTTSPAPSTTAQPSGYQRPDNPYDDRVTDLINQLGQSINTPRVNPYDSQIQSLLAEIQTMMNRPPVDPRTTNEYAAGKASVDRQAAESVRRTMEALGGSGLARSSIALERTQDINNSATEYLETQLVPTIAAQLRAQDLQGIQTSMALLQGLSQQQGMFDQRTQNELQNLGALLGALTGQQGVFDERAQTDFQNNLGLENLDINRQQLDLSRQQVDLQRQAQEFNQQQASIQNELAQIGAALERTQILGSVSNEDSSILGVPAGTPTFQAREAAAQRQQQLSILDRQLEAERSNLERRIAADAEQSRLNRQAQQNSARVSELLNIWQATNSAPPGLESYGIRPGQTYNPSLTPSQQLDQLQLEQMQADASEQARVQQLVPVFQATYSLDTITAQAMVSAMDNPTLESAIEDIKAHENQLKQMGVNTKKLRDAVRSEFSKSNDPYGNITFDPSSLNFWQQPATVTQDVFGR